jgi:poly(3-hydroxybutyrate) depolymerase
MRLRGRLAMVALAAAALVAAAALAAPAPSATGRSSGQIIRIVEIGNGAGAAWLFVPAKPPSCVVVFIHGAGDLTPVRYEAWLDYLAISKGCAVIFPRYQATAAAGTPEQALRGLRAGIATSLAYLRNARFGLYRERARAVLPVVVAGFAYGGSLAIYYAANAQRWGLPVPAAIDSIFPVPGRIPGAPLAPLPRSTRVLIQVGDQDRVAGRAGGDDLWRYLASHPAARKRFQLVRSTEGLKAVHVAPLQPTAAAQSVFWPPLDAFIDDATGG